jgi:hypothetical protein
MVLRTASWTVGKPLGAVLLGGVILWQCAEHAGSPKGRAIVHVATLPADLVIDHAVYRVEDLSRSPIVCELRPGRHNARLLRDGQVLYQEEFLARADEEVILTAWDGYRDGRSPGRVEGESLGRRRPDDAAGPSPPTILSPSSALAASSRPRPARNRP